jgi:hypothetical protein
MSEANDVGPKDGRLDELLISHLDSAYNLARWLMRNSHDSCRPPRVSFGMPSTNSGITSAAIES